MTRAAAGRSGRYSIVAPLVSRFPVQARNTSILVDSGDVLYCYPGLLPATPATRYN